MIIRQRTAEERAKFGIRAPADDSDNDPIDLEALRAKLDGLAPWLQAIGILEVWNRLPSGTKTLPKSRVVARLFSVSHSSAADARRRR